MEIYLCGNMFSMDIYIHIAIYIYISVEIWKYLRIMFLLSGMSVGEYQYLVYTTTEIVLVEFSCFLANDMILVILNFITYYEK